MGSPMKPDNEKQPETSILIVDDNPQFAGLLRRILDAGFGYKDITLMHSLEEAYRAISSDPEKFSMLFVDFRFPEGGNGGEFLERLKSKDLLQDKVAFLITSEPTVENQRQAMRAGASGVVGKPFDRASLEQQLSKVRRRIETDSSDNF